VSRWFLAIACKRDYWYSLTMTTWQAQHVPLPLGGKPTLLWATVGIHGPDEVKRYRFERVWIVHLYRYSGSVTIDRVEYPIRPGYASIMPPGATSVTHFPALSRHLFAHFLLPAAEGATVPVRVMQDLGDEFATMHDAFEQMLGYASTYPLRAEVRLWDILWRLAERSAGAPAATPVHPAVGKVKQMIELRLTERLCVADLAREVGLSHNHLTRLFRQATGETVSEYIRSLQIERARYLLTHSTLSIKSIAQEVGVHDLHRFNKMVRRNLGAAPRTVRSRRPEV
jgi:AraC-like DNA-binding protein